VTIQIAQVSKRYGAVTALDRVSLEIREGERVAFVGTNGSGKTTLLRCLLGLLRFEGKVTLAGSDVAREPELALRSVAYIPQIAPPIDAPVQEVVTAYLGLRGRPAESLSAWTDRLGLDLGASATKRFRDLSGGMKQKLLAALALATDAPILVCDEPTANLDGEARAEFIRELARRDRRHTLILCSHRVDEVSALVDRIVELHDGRIKSDAGIERETSQGAEAPRLKVVS
jgi:ABC-2 type transport system ATP-binding protein